MKNNVSPASPQPPPAPAVCSAVAIERANTLARPAGVTTTKRVLHGLAKPVQQIIALQINLRERPRPLLYDLFSYDSTRITALGSPQRVPEYMGGRYTQASRLATWTRRLRPGTHPVGRKERRGKEGKKLSSLRGSWYLLVASASLPRHCCGLSSRGGASPGDKRVTGVRSRE